MKIKLIMTTLGVLISSSGFAQILPFSDREMQVYANKYEELAFRSSVAAEDDFVVLKKTHIVPSELCDYVKNVYKEREVRKVTHDYFEANAKERVKAKIIIDSLYPDSIDACLMPFNECIAGRTISIALRSGEALKIAKVRQNAILHVGLDVAHRLLLNPRYVYDVQVMDSLKKILTMEQLTQILDSKNAAYVVRKSRDTWNSVKEARLTDDVDSAAEYQRMLSYYLIESRINDMYVGHEKIRDKYMKDLWKQQPLLVRMYGSLYRKMQITRNKKEDDSNDLVW